MTINVVHNDDVAIFGFVELMEFRNPFLFLHNVQNLPLRRSHFLSWHFFFINLAYHLSGTVFSSLLRMHLMNLG